MPVPLGFQPEVRLAVFAGPLRRYGTTAFRSQVPPGGPVADLQLAALGLQGRPEDFVLEPYRTVLVVQHPAQRQREDGVFRIRQVDRSALPFEAPRQGQFEHARAVCLEDRFESSVSPGGHRDGSCAAVHREAVRYRDADLRFHVIVQLALQGYAHRPRCAGSQGDLPGIDGKRHLDARPDAGGEVDGKIVPTYAGAHPRRGFLHVHGFCFGRHTHWRLEGDRLAGSQRLPAVVVDRQVARLFRRQRDGGRHVLPVLQFPPKDRLPAPHRLDIVHRRPGGQLRRLHRGHVPGFAVYPNRQFLPVCGGPGFI